MARETVISGHDSVSMSFTLTGRQVEQRRKACTDLPCCLLFVACFIGMMVLGGFGFTHGHPNLLERLVRGQDFDGRLCGKDKGVEHFPLAYYTLESGQKVPKGDWTDTLRMKMKMVCTKSCPKNSTASEVYKRNSDECPSDTPSDWCTWYGAKTTRFANYCIDTDVFPLKSVGTLWVKDLKAAMYHLIAIFPVAISIGMLYLTTMEHCGAFFVWSLLALVIILPAGIGFWFYSDASLPSETKDLVKLKSQDAKLIGIGCWVFSALILLITCCNLKAINGVAAVVKGTSQFLKDVKSQFLQPLIFGLLHLVVMVAWLLILFFVLSIGAKAGDPMTCLKKAQLICVDFNEKNTTYYLIFLLLMIFWILNFLHAVSHFGTAFAVREWYFTKADETGAKKPLLGGHTFCDCKLSLAGVKKGLFYHSGSFAFGALCISICKVIRFLLFWVSKDEEARSTNPVMKCVLRCANCLAACLERFIEFVSEHAYVEMAMEGRGFCTSAKKAMSMAVMRPALFALVGRVACMVKLLGVALIAIAGGYIVSLLLKWFPADGLTNPTPAVVAAALFSLFIGEIMMHPFTAAARACLHCYYIDEENSVGNLCEHTPQSLQRFVEDHKDSDHHHSRCCC